MTTTSGQQNDAHKRLLERSLPRRFHPIDRQPDKAKQKAESDKRLELAGGSSREGLTSGLGALAEHLLGLVATQTSTPLPALVLVLVRAATWSQSVPTDMKTNRMNEKGHTS